MKGAGEELPEEEPVSRECLEEEKEPPVSSPRPEFLPYLKRLAMMGEIIPDSGKFL